MKEHEYNVHQRYVTRKKKKYTDTEKWSKKGKSDD
jgi:hypothetical protein